jgi:hypothetical protein
VNAPNPDLWRVQISINLSKQDGSICRHAPARLTMGVGIGSSNSRYPLPACETCSDRFGAMLLDLPYLRFMLSRYVPVQPGAPIWAWLNQ